MRLFNHHFTVFKKITFVATALLNIASVLIRLKKQTALKGAFDATFFSFDTTSFGVVQTITIISKLKFGVISMR